MSLENRDTYDSIDVPSATALTKTQGVKASDVTVSHRKTANGFTARAKSMRGAYIKMEPGYLPTKLVVRAIAAARTERISDE